MDVEEFMAKAGDHLSVRRAFGAPIDRDGVTLIPVAVAIGGGGGGSGPEDQGSGGGFGGLVRGIGVYAVRDGQVRFVPAIDAVTLGVLFLLIARTLARMTKRRRGKR